MSYEDLLTEGYQDLAGRFAPQIPAGGLELFVSPVTGSDANSGLSRGQALGTIAKAVSIATPAGGATIYLSVKGTHITNGTINAIHCTIYGYGAIVQSAPGVNAFTMFQMGDGFKMLGVTIDGNKSNTNAPSGTQGQGVYIYNGTGVFSSKPLLRDVIVKNVWANGIRVGTGVVSTDAASQVPSTPVDIDHCSITNTGTQGIVMFNVGDVNVSECLVTNTGSDGIYDFMTLRSGIDNNRIIGAGNHGIVTQFSANASITGNRVKGSVKSGLCVGGGTIGNTPATGWTISGNTSTDNTWHGVDIDTTLTDNSYSDSPGTIGNNTCSKNTLGGIYINGSRRVAVNGNQCKDNAAYGIGLSGQYVCVTGNEVSGNNTGIAFMGTAGQVNGSYRLSGNSVHDNTTADYSYGADITVTAPNSPIELFGSGAPAMDAPLGSTYHNSSGGAGTSLYVKESAGAGGWVAK